MAYQYATLAQVRAQLADRLQDNGIFPGTVPNTFWTAAELNALIVESIRAWQALTGYYRQRVSFPTVTGQAFYDLSTSGQLPAGQMDYNVTLNDAVAAILYRLMEPQLQAGVYVGTDQFTLDGIVTAINRRRDRFLGDTGSVVSHTAQAVAAPPIGRIPLADTVMDVRRAAWGV